MSFNHSDVILIIFNYSTSDIRLPLSSHCRSRWPRGLRHTSAAARLLRLRVRIQPGAWMSVCCECCVLSGRGLCDELITRSQESYRLWCVVVCNPETSWIRRPWPTGGGGGAVAPKTNKIFITLCVTPGAILLVSLIFIIFLIVSTNTSVF